MTQNDRIVMYMREVGSISPLDAIREFGCMRLAARIADLKREGWQVQRVMEQSVNRFGDTVRYARYTLEGIQ